MTSSSAFTKFINSLTEEELREEFKSIYKKIPAIKKHYAMELGSDDDRKKLFDKTKKGIKGLLYIGKRPRKRPRILKIKNLIKEQVKLSVFEHETADLYLYAAEQELEFIMDRYTSVKAVFNNCVLNFEKACEMIDHLSLHDMFKERCQTFYQNADVVYMISEEVAEIYTRTFRG